MSEWKSGNKKIISNSKNKKKYFNFNVENFNVDIKPLDSDEIKRIYKLIEKNKSRKL